ncbi:MAG: glycosyltransferase family A protein [Actinomycetota bacterium]
MILPVVFATYNRFPLLRQTVETLIKNTDSELEIVILDASDNWEGIEHYLKRKKTKVIYKHLEKRVPIYEAKNLGVSLASPSEYIHIADDDIYYEPHWDTRLMEVLHYFPDIGVVGGKKHPHHQTLKTIEFRGYKILVVNNQPGYSFLSEGVI